MVKEYKETSDNTETYTANLYKCARELDVPVRWLKRAAIEGKVPCLRIGKRQIIFNVEAVKKAIYELTLSNSQTERKLTVHIARKMGR